MKAIMKKAKTNTYTYNERAKELTDFAQTIDFTELFAHTTKFANVTCGFNQPEITESRGRVYIEFTSDDVTEQTGLFAAILKRSYIYTPNNGVFRDEKTGELTYWVSVNVRYEHKDGGSNGMELFRAWYTDSKGWIFE